QYQALHPSAASVGTPLPTRRENQDEQLRPEAACRRNGSEVVSRRREAGGQPSSPRPVRELVEDGDDAVDGIDLAVDALGVEVTSGACDAEPEDDLAPAGHRALDANGAIAPARGESFACVETNRIDGALHLTTQIWI